MALSALPGAGNSEFKANLNELRHLLKNLPEDLPILPLGKTKYRRIAEGDMDSEWAEEIVLAGAANRLVELAFPSKDHIKGTSSDCVPLFHECGPVVESIVKFLADSCRVPQPQ
jgi:hypothetical protein